MIDLNKPPALRCQNCDLNTQPNKWSPTVTSSRFSTSINRSTDVISFHGDMKGNTARWSHFLAQLLHRNPFESVITSIIWRRRPPTHDYNLRLNSACVHVCVGLESTEMSWRIGEKEGDHKRNAFLILYVQICQKSRRIGCVTPHCMLQRGITQPILRL